MIKFLSGWVEGIAVAVIIASIFEMLLPNGNIKKYVKIVLGIFIIFNIISPFVNGNVFDSIDLEKELNNYISNTNTTASSNKQNNLDKMYIDTFENDLKEQIENQGYDVDNCEVDASFDTEKNDFGINKINIKLSSKNKKTKEENANNMIDIKNIENIDIHIGNNLEENTAKSNLDSKDIDLLKDYLSKHYEIDKNIININ